MPFKTLKVGGLTLEYKLDAPKKGIVLVKVPVTLIPKIGPAIREALIRELKCPNNFSIAYTNDLKLGVVGVAQTLAGFLPLGQRAGFVDKALHPWAFQAVGAFLASIGKPFDTKNIAIVYTGKDAPASLENAVGPRIAENEFVQEPTAADDDEEGRTVRERGAIKIILNRALYTEGTIVHELFHAAGHPNFEKHLNIFAEEAIVEFCTCQTLNIYERVGRKGAGNYRKNVAILRHLLSTGQLDLGTVYDGFFSGHESSIEKIIALYDPLSIATGKLKTATEKYNLLKNPLPTVQTVARGM